MVPPPTPRAQLSLRPQTRTSGGAGFHRPEQVRDDRPAVWVTQVSVGARPCRPETRTCSGPSGCRSPWPGAAPPSQSLAARPTRHLHTDPDPRPLEALNPPFGRPNQPPAAQGTDTGSVVSSRRVSPGKGLPQSWEGLRGLHAGAEAGEPWEEEIHSQAAPQLMRSMSSGVPGPPTPLPASVWTEPCPLGASVLWTPSDGKADRPLGAQGTGRGVPVGEGTEELLGPHPPQSLHTPSGAHTHTHTLSQSHLCRHTSHSRSHTRTYAHSHPQASACAHTQHTHMCGQHTPQLTPRPTQTYTHVNIPALTGTCRRPQWLLPHPPVPRRWGAPQPMSPPPHTVRRTWGSRASPGKATGLPQPVLGHQAQASRSDTTAVCQDVHGATTGRRATPLTLCFRS